MYVNTAKTSFVNETAIITVAAMISTLNLLTLICGSNDFNTESVGPAMATAIITVATCCHETIPRHVYT